MTGQDPTERSRDEATTSAAEIEGRIEELAEQIGRLIDSSPAAEREALHDYAVSLVREKLPVIDPTPAADETAGGDVAAGAGASNTAALLGYGVLLIPVAFLMLLVFAPLGAVLLAAGVGMATMGVVLALVNRVRRA